VPYFEKEIGVVSERYYYFGTAITKLMYLQQGIAPDEFKTIFETLRGDSTLKITFVVSYFAV
jgi:hypothetical protein